MYKYFATVARGLEPVAAAELEKLGAQEIKTDFTGVHFQGDLALLYRVNLWSRTIFRVLMFIAEVPCETAQELYLEVKKIDWFEYFSPSQTLAVNSTGSNKNLNHSHFTALQIKNAIVDQQRDRSNIRSNIDPANPEILVNAHIHKNSCILSLDSSGGSLHRRGYRPAMGLAPLKETLAAAIIQLSDWEPNLAFFDPLCGSGTLPIEAALVALNIPPGLYKQKFCFQNWPNFDQSLWEDILTTAKNNQLSELKAPIFGSDHDAEIISQARQNATNCNLDKHISFTQQELAQVEAPSDRGVIICNPPYGKRIGEEEELGSLYKLLGDIFKQRFKGWTAYILTGNKELAKKVGLKASRRIPINNGDLPCTLLKYELY